MPEFLDVGLLGAMTGSPVELVTQGERLFNEYEGAFVENYVAQQMVSHYHQISGSLLLR